MDPVARNRRRSASGSDNTSNRHSHEQGQPSGGARGACRRTRVPTGGTDRGTRRPRQSVRPVLGGAGKSAQKGPKGPFTGSTGGGSNQDARSTRGVGVVR